MMFAVLGILVDAWSIARLGLPLAVIGAARTTGWPALLVALMSLWLVPLPNSILALATPHPESAFAALEYTAGPARSLLVGDAAHAVAHADLFIADLAPAQIFDPIARWLKDVTP